MKLRYHFSRRRRQLAHLAKGLVRRTEAGLMVSDKQLARLKRLAGYLVPRIGGEQVRKALGAGLFLLASTGTQAQTFAEPTTNPFGIDSSLTEYVEYSQTVLADLDGDGDLDLLTTRLEYEGVYSDRSSLIYQENIGTAAAPAFGAPQVNPFGFVPSIQVFAVDAVDLDGDGDLDLFLNGATYLDMYSDRVPENAFYENTGEVAAPSFGAPDSDAIELSVPDPRRNLLFPIFGDLDGDGDLDILAQSFYDYSYYESVTLYYENVAGEDAPPDYGNPVTSPFGLDLYIFDQFSELVDVDNDGDLDLIGANSTNDDLTAMYVNEVILIENTGTATTPEFPEQISNPFGIDRITGELLTFGQMAAGDLDNDDDVDLLLMTEVGALYYENLDPLSVRNNFIDLPVTLSPNPTGGDVAIATETRVRSLEVFNGLGQRVLRQPGNVSRVDLTGLPAGNYTFKFVLDDGKFGTQRVVKQ